MKKFTLNTLIKTLLVLLLAFGSFNVTNAQVTLLTEGFEGGALPAGWTQEYVSGAANWIYANGGHNAYPAAAHTGTMNAQFYQGNYSGYTTKLVTPSVNTLSVATPQLTFWHAQVEWAGDIDEHRIYYKTSSGGTWTLLATYTAAISGWTQEVIPLPSPSATYYIAFEGVGLWGYGVCIDDITISGLAHPVGCGNTPLGTLVPTASWQNAPYTAGTIPYWSFNATAGTWYDFSLCSNSEDSYMRLYNSSGTMIASNDDSGPFCSGFSSSMSWLCPTTGLYYISSAGYSCAGFVNSGDMEYRAITRACPDCAPADAALGNITTAVWGGTITGNCLDGGKWTGSFQGKPGSVYHFDLCPDAGGAGTANFDVDIKIVDSACTILDGTDGSCSVSNIYRPNDFTWTCPGSGTYYVVLAPYSSHHSHNCIGNSANTFTMEYYREIAPLVCPPGSIAEGEPDCVAGYVDATNGGCNSTPYVYTILPTNCSAVFCGTSGTYDVSGSTYRDTDWIQFTATDSTDVFIDAIAQFDLMLGLIDGTAGCPVSSFYTSASVAEGDTAHIATVVGPGTWWIWVGPSNWNNWPCGSKYILNFSTVATPPVPVAVSNPSCGPTTLNPLPDGHFESNYWQGTSCGTSLSDPATSTYPVNTSGQYFINAYNSGTGCWSACNALNVLINPTGTLTATSNGNTDYDTVCPADPVNLDATYTLVTTDSLLYRWSVAGTVVRDWDADPQYVAPSGTDTTYTVEVTAVNFNVLMLFGDDLSLAGRTAIENDPRIGVVDSFDIRLGSPSVATMLSYGAVIIYTDYTPADPAGMGDTLKKFVDMGGKLVSAFATQNLTYGVAGSYVTQAYDPITATALYGSGATNIGTIVQPAHPLLAGVTSLIPGYHSNATTITAGAQDIFYWGDGTIGAAFKAFPAGAILSLSYLPPFASGPDVYLMLANAADFMIHYNGCIVSDQVMVTVSPLPGAVGAIVGADSVCAGESSVGYSVSAVADADSYTWTYTGSGATINGTGAGVSIDFSLSATSGDLTVTPMNSCGAGTPSSAFTIVVNPLPGAAASISGTDTVCAGDNAISYMVGVITNADTYDWTYSGTGATINGTGDSITIDFAAGATSGTLTVEGVNDCGNGTVSAGFDIVVNDVPATPAAVTGSDTVCQGEAGVAYSVPVIAGAGTYVWSYTGTGATINGSGNAITIDFSATATTGVLSVYAQNDCGNSAVSPSFDIYVDPCSGIDSWDAAGKIAIVPNPGPGKFSVLIDADSKTSYRMKITDITGRVVKDNDLTVASGPNRIDIDLSNYPSGTYYLSLENENAKIIKPVVIVR